MTHPQLARRRRLAALVAMFAAILALSVRPVSAQFNVTAPTVGVRALDPTNNLACRFISAGATRLPVTRGLSTSFTLHVFTATSGLLTPRFGLASSTADPSPVGTAVSDPGAGPVTFVLVVPDAVALGPAYIEFFFATIASGDLFQCVDINIVAASPPPPVSPPPPPPAPVAASAASATTYLGLKVIPFSLVAATLALLFCCLLLALLLCCLCRRRRQKKNAEKELQPEVSAPAPVVIVSTPAASATPTRRVKRRRTTATANSPNASASASMRGSRRLHHHSKSKVRRSPYIAPNGVVLTKIVQIDESSSAWLDGGSSSSQLDSNDRSRYVDDEHEYEYEYQTSSSV